MAKYSKQFIRLLPTISGIASYIEIKVGGAVFLSEDKDLKAVNFRWKKNDPKTMEMLRLNYKVSYDELETAVEPMAIAVDIIDKINKREE